MTEARDTQRAKLYRAETKAQPNIVVKPGTGLTVAECEAFYEDLLESAWFRDPANGLHHRPSVIHVHDGRGRRRGAHWMEIDGSHVTIPRACRTIPYLLHELAHATSHNGKRAPHGWQFAHDLLLLTGHVMGEDRMVKLRQAFRAEHVKYREPTSECLKSVAELMPTW